jgi:ribonuclease G
MAEELLIQVCDFESRVALIKDGAVHEVQLARSAGYSVTGNIYLGKVVRIIPGMQAAFVEIGLERPGFLHAADIQAPLITTASDPEHKPGIRELLHDGQELLVQVERDPIGAKGARLSTRLTLASKYLVLTPTSQQVAISQRIDEDAQRQRLFKILRPLVESAGYGVIARTLSEDASALGLQQDYQRLVQLWEQLAATREAAAPGSLVYEELPIQTRLVRDLVGPDTAAIEVDHAETFRRLDDYLSKYAPVYRDKLRYWQDHSSVFARHNIEGEIAAALSPRVALPSGGTLVIEQTEAMISIDVNTASFLGSKNLEETAFRTNLEAAGVIPRQLQLRNLGGIIVIDFIDMANSDHQDSVLTELSNHLAKDSVTTNVVGFSDLGLVQLSRKRSRQSLAQQMCAACPHCEGMGLVKTAESVCMEVFRAMAAEATDEGRRWDQEGSYSLVTTAAVADRLLDEESAVFAKLSAGMGHPVRLQVDSAYAPGRFDLFFVSDHHGSS